MVSASVLLVVGHLTAEETRSSDCNSLRFVEELGDELESLLCRSLDVEQLASSFAEGKIESCPFKPRRWRNCCSVPGILTTGLTPGHR